jgi:hypothetical protein
MRGVVRLLTVTAKTSQLRTRGLRFSRGWPLLAPKSGAEYASSAVSITVVLSMDLLLYWSASFRLKG